MGWQDTTITLGELARLLREERMLPHEVGYPGDFNNGLDTIAMRVGAELKLDDAAQLAFGDEACVLS